MTLDSLPDDVLDGIALRTEPRDVLSLELVCKKLQDSVHRHELWRAMVTIALAPLLHSASLLPLGSRYKFSHVGIFKLLLAALQAQPTPVSLLEDVVTASSTDNAREAADHVLYPKGVYPSGSASYWSSAGNTSETSNESITFKLVHPFCILHRVEIRPFRAKWQQGRPVYAPRAMQLSFTSDDGHTWTSPTYPVKNSCEAQMFDLPKVACPVNEVTVTLLGRHQFQMEDGLYYTCIRYVRLLGIPLSHFRLTSDGCLTFLREDPLQKRGGLPAVSEKGRRVVTCPPEQLFQVQDSFDPLWWSDSDLASDSESE